MKFKRLGYILVVAAVAIIVSCTKEAKFLKVLEGEWDVISVVMDGVEQPSSSYKDLVYVFDNCKETDEVCYGRIKNEATHTTDEFSYQMGESMEDFAISYTGNFDEDLIYDVDEHTPTKFVFSMTDTVGSITTISLDKRN